MKYSISPEDGRTEEKSYLPTFVVILLAAGIIALVLSWLFRLQKETKVYKQALVFAKQHPTAKKLLGTPMEDRWPVMGTIRERGAYGMARFKMFLQGPRNKGVLQVRAKKKKGKWKVSRYILRVDKKKYDLLEE